MSNPNDSSVRVTSSAPSGATKPEQEAPHTARAVPSAAQRSSDSVHPAESSNAPELRGPLPLRVRDQFLFVVTSVLALFFMVLYCLRTSNWGADPIELENQPQRELNFTISLNEATWVEWSQLPGIGPILANRIVEDREQNGPYDSVDDLDRVKGLGPKKIDAIRPFVRVDTNANTDSEKRGR